MIDRPDGDTPWRWYGGLQTRMRDGVDELDHLLAMSGVGYELTDRSTVWVGYGFTPRFPASGGVSTEHRFWPQYTWASPFARGSFAARSRLEGRVLEGADSLAWRFRQRLRYSVPVSTGSPVAILLWDEGFTHLNATARISRGFNQNWFFEGALINLPDNVNLRLGYQHQFVNGQARPDRSHHILSTTLDLRLLP